MGRRPSLSALSCTAFIALLLLLPTGAVAAAKVSAKASDTAFERAARSVERGGQLDVEGLLLEGDGATTTLELERFEVWRPDAIVMIDDRQVPAPKTLYFRGSVAGHPGSTAMLSVREGGGTMGLVFRGDGGWAIGKGRGQGALRSRKAGKELDKPFECGLDELLPGDAKLGVDDPFGGSVAAADHTVLDSPYVANIAVETDFEYFVKLGSEQAALDYMADLFGYADLVYSREIDTDMQIGFARIWTSSSDPWTATTSSNSLYEFRNYWNANMRHIQRTVAHMLSGRSTGGGVAWVGQLCDSYARSSSYDYGYSGALGGSFRWDGDPSHDPANVVWDIMVVQHEIGHNFNSPHTHDYCGIGGSSEPIDRCYQGCAGAGQGLPSCSSPTPFFDGGAGTIMSYCHLQSGGYSNQAMTFGEGHTCGVLPGRAADRMSAHVISRANAFPGCFQAGTCGNGRIDAGEECDGGLLNGNTCSSEGFFGGTLSCNSNCTLNTSQCHNCGDNFKDPEEVCDGTDLGGQTCSGLFGCAGGELSCDSTCDAFDSSSCTLCPPCNHDGTCDALEDCNGCPDDCPGGISSGATCGNGVCEAGNGEDCLSCPSDCNGTQGGKPSNRYCCGDGDGTNPASCSDSRCNAGGNSCTDTPVEGGPFCCGDLTCDPGENCATCALDCNEGPEVCDNGVDDDCNGFVDCNDPFCALADVCLCGGSDASCALNDDCCSGSCRTKGRKAGTCA